MSYLVLDLAFLGLAAVLVALLSRRAVRSRDGARRRPGTWAALLAAGAVLLVLTAVFDNVIIALGLYGYAPASLAGAFLGVVPVEDFAYPVAAAVLVPALWHALTRRAARQPGARRRPVRTQERP